ncbi:spatacsin [Impatiens glandulifera]|uniref:spatacsin n=1 Tax=Impatiens glandulifera TaxID=253017 RepID=UPI001FB0C937|nr:spatacsin [Impatiens glandulifera]
MPKTSMDLNSGHCGPSILQLLKWQPNDCFLDLSEFREAFISPSRELLLLLSHHSEALLFPLVKGLSICQNDSGSHPSERFSEPIGSSSLELTVHSQSVSKENIYNNLESINIDSENSFNAEINCSKSNNYPYLYDVKSLAWGVCGESYEQPGDDSFRELIFISGSNCVTVHAFCQPRKDSKGSELTLGSENAEGSWVEWGPPTCLTSDMVVDDGITMSCQSPEADGPNEARGSPKRWLQTFFVETETSNLDGNIWTKFPEMFSIPPDATVVSFSIFDSVSPLLDVLLHAHSGLDTEVTGEVKPSDIDSSSLGVQSRSSYTCSRVFPSNSHQLIGFLLTSLDSPAGVRNKDCLKNFIAVAKLRSRGIQWVCTLNLDKIVDSDRSVEWADFGFSNDFLVCLSASGKVFFHHVLTGEYIGNLDALEICGFHNQLIPQDKEDGFVEGFQALRSLDSQYTHENGFDSDCFNHTNKIVGKRIFKRLLFASNTHLLAAVDEYSVIYVICTREHIPTKYFPIENRISHLWQFEHGILGSWEVGGADISQQKQFFTGHKKDNGVGGIQDKLMMRKEVEAHAALCAASDKTDNKHRMRRIILPIDKFNKNGVVCFSPFGVTQMIEKHTKGIREIQIAHSYLYLESAVDEEKFCNLQGSDTFTGKAIGFTFQGYLYLFMKDGLSIVLPSISVSPNFLPVEAIGYQQPNTSAAGEYSFAQTLEFQGPRQTLSSWKVEVLDRALLYESPEAGDLLCLQNGWDLKFSRIRRLQLVLIYLKFEEIENALDMLVDVNLAEEGVQRLIFAAMFLMLGKVGIDGDVSAASRILALATRFATKMLRKYGLLKSMIQEALLSSQSHMRTGVSSPSTVLPDVELQLKKMSHLLEIIRNLQCRLIAKFKRRNEGWEDGIDVLSLVDAHHAHDNSELFVSGDAVSTETSHQNELYIPTHLLELKNGENLTLAHMDSPSSDPANYAGIPALLREGSASGINIPLENPKDMITRWETNNLDIKTVVKDALLCGRLPLAVLQLHLHRRKSLMEDEDPTNTFSEVRDVGRAIAYDLFLEGEIELAVATLLKLGDDVETSLKQLCFGTVRKSLRKKIVEEMIKYDYLKQDDWESLERISLIERSYGCSSFWETYHGRQKESMRNPAVNFERKIKLCLSHTPSLDNLTIQCGEIDGVVLGSWVNISQHSHAPEADEDKSHVAYWVAAAIWSEIWDQTTVDRIVMDRSQMTDIGVSWESELEYHICHNHLVEVMKLLDVIPSSMLSDGHLQVNLDNLNSSSSYDGEFPDYVNYSHSLSVVDTVSLDIPGVRILTHSASDMCSMWLRTIMEQHLAHKSIFLKAFWEGPSDLVAHLARAGFIGQPYQMPHIDQKEDYVVPDLSTVGTSINLEMLQGVNKLIVLYIVQNNLPNLLDLYLDHHKLALDKESFLILRESSRGSQWAEWLFLSRMKGYEYDASFSNARFIASNGLVHGNNLSILEIDDMIGTVDDIAEGGGELAALATLMYARAPIQDCLSSGSVNRQSSSSGQCTLENLRPTLQHYPILWRTLVAACFGQDICCQVIGPKTRPMLGNSDLFGYLDWRKNIFFSAGRDTSLLQMLPRWFPKAVKRLIQLYVQGPLGWHSLTGLSTGEVLLGDIDYLVSANMHDVSPISWESAIHKCVKEQLYASSLEKNRIGLEHHLHRGRALAAFNHLLAVRVQKLKLEQAQINDKSDMQLLLAPITESEEPLLSSVLPLAIKHFEDSQMVASCAFLLELFGLSARMLQIDVAALRRISSFYQSSEYANSYKEFSPKSSAFHSILEGNNITDSLAQALADEYMRHNPLGILKKPETPSVSIKRSSRALSLVLQHLEKASLPMLSDGKTCGSWLLNGNGDGAALRSQQKLASQHWNLVTNFCQMHHIPLSTKYLTMLSRDNDWVGFLSEAQIGEYSLESVIQIASKDFSDTRLRNHILTVLKGLLAKKKIGSSPTLDTSENKGGTAISEENTFIPTELFGILADCEKQKSPGKVLLLKAKELCWSVLAMIASCFSDVTPLSCLTVWLEITAARETSSIKVNDIASQIACSVAAAVEATNSLPPSSRDLTFHYNHKSPKRRRLIEPQKMNHSASLSGSTTTATSSVFSSQGLNAGEENRERSGVSILSDSEEAPVSLSRMVSVLCEQHLFLPLLKAFEMFLPSCTLLPFIRALEAFSQMRLSEASAHLGSFSVRLKEELTQPKGQIGNSWISLTAVKAADAILSTCPSPYEKRCLLQLLSATDFGDGGSAASNYRRQYWKINLAEPCLRNDNGLRLGNETLDDASLLAALERNGRWDQARNWARQLEDSSGSWKSAVHHITETQAESMVAEWKEFLWDVPEERVALWGHCQTLFVRYSFPPLQAGTFFLKHAEAVEKDLPAKELHELLLLSLQWLSGLITQSNPVYPLHLLREIETRVWLLAVESEAQVKSDGDFSSSSGRENVTGKFSSMIDKTASIITKMDNHIGAMMRKSEKNDSWGNNQIHNRISQFVDSGFTHNVGVGTKTKRKVKGSAPSRKPLLSDVVEKTSDAEDSSILNLRNDSHLVDESSKIEASFSRWEERVGPQELERAVLSLLEFGQIIAAKQLQNKLSPAQLPPEFTLVDAALKLAAVSAPANKVSISMLDEEVRSVIHSYSMKANSSVVDPLQVLESMTNLFVEGNGRGLCKRIIAVVKAANILGLPFSEAFEKQPIELLRLLSLKAQDSYDEANLLVQTHSMPAANIAQVLAESFLKGLLAAHRGGYMESQKEEGPSPLLWRFSDFLKWAELCSSEPEIGHALMRLVITSQEIPHACEVELLILSHHFYKSSACLDGVDVLVALATTRVEAYVAEGDFPCLARLITGVGNFHALNFILGILIENGQLELLLQKYSAAADTNVQGFRMTVLTALKQFNPDDLDAFAMVYTHFDMKHETASLLESRAKQSSHQWFLRYDKDQNEDLLESMRYYIEASEVHSSIDAGNKTHTACSRASLVSLQIRMPDFRWLDLSETNARRALVEQTRFQDALIVADAYSLNQPSEWALVLWNHMLKPELLEQFVAEFVAVLPLQPSTLADLARFYKSELAARGDQSQFTVWLTGGGGGVPSEWAKYLWRSFKCLMKRTRDLRLRLQLVTNMASTDFGEVIDACNRALDRVPDNAGPLVLRKGHGGAYLPLM